MSGRKHLLAEIKTFAPQSDADRAAELEKLLTKIAELHFPPGVCQDKHFQQGIRFTLQTIFGRGR